MDARRKWFLAALGLFVAWVVALGVMALLSARTPRAARPAPPAGRAA
jgi:hypothetical protein